MPRSSRIFRASSATLTGTVRLGDLHFGEQSGDRLVVVGMPVRQVDHGLVNARQPGDQRARRALDLLLQRL